MKSPFFLGAFILSIQLNAADCVQLFVEKYNIPTTTQLSKGIIENYTQNGKLVLFRAINGEYIKAHVPRGSFAEQEGSYAYSLVPNVPIHWGHLLKPSLDKKRILIAIQNVERDDLLYPKDKTVFAGHLENYIPLTLQTEVEAIPFMNEIRVPFHKEKVVAIIDYDIFVKMIERAGDNINPFEFVEKILRGPLSLGF